MNYKNENNQTNLKMVIEQTFLRIEIYIMIEILLYFY